MISLVVLMLFIFTLSQLTWPGVKILYDIFTSPTSNNQRQNFSWLSYKLKKMYYHIKITSMIFLVFMTILFCTTNTWL